MKNNAITISNIIIDSIMIFLELPLYYTISA